MQPKQLSGGMPQASVDYGFQTSQSVSQAVATPATRSRSSPTTRTEPAMSDRKPIPRPPPPGPRLGRLGGAGDAGPRRGHARAHPAAASRPLARLHHRRPGRARLRQPEAVHTAVEESRTAGRPPESLLVSKARSTPNSSRARPPSATGSTTSTSPIYQVDVAAAALFPVTMARRYKAVPVGYVDQQTLLVAAVDPANVLAVDDIQIATGLDCQIAVAAKDDVEALLGPARHDAERRRRRDRRGAGPGRGSRGAGTVSPQSATCRPAPRTRR